MKVGDLVRWTHPDFKDTGIIIELWDRSNIVEYTDGTHDSVHIIWSKNPENSGPHPAHNEYLELISERR